MHKFGFFPTFFVFSATPAVAASVGNVVLIVSDNLRAGVLGRYGGTVGETSLLGRLAARGMVFGLRDWPRKGGGKERNGRFERETRSVILDGKNDVRMRKSVPIPLPPGHAKTWFARK